jgi:hypothetical protein
MKMQDKEKSPLRRSGLILLPFLILAILLAAPPTRALFLAQLHLLHPSGPFFPPMAEMGVKEGPITPAPVWKPSLIAEGKRRFPDDYTIQIGAALLEGANVYVSGGNANSKHDQYNGFQRRYGERLAALSARFPDRPGPYAHLLRYMTQGTVRVSRDAEVEKFQVGRTSRLTDKKKGYVGANPPASFGGMGSHLTDKQIGYADSWAAYEQAAAQGENLDPDNAYFPMMRAIGLFDAKRDAEGIAAVLRAGQKSRFDDYTDEEAEAKWTLCRHVYGPSSVLVRRNIACAVVLPHLAPLRAESRLIAYFAERAELEGRIQEGRDLRHAMMQCGILMRDQNCIIGARTGIGIVSFQTNLPGGMQTLPPLDNYASDQAEDSHRDLYSAYLHQIGAEEEARWFAGVDATDRQVRALLNTEKKDNLITASTRSLPSLWMLDMLLLTNMLTLLLFCTAAVVCTRLSGGERALPIVVFVLLACCLLGALLMRWADALTQIRWLFNDMGNNSWQGPDFLNVPRLLMQFPSAIHVGEVLFSLLIPVLTLLTLGVVSAVRREAFTVALSRGLQRGALSVAALLTVTYAGALIATAQAECRGAAGLYCLMPHAVTALQHRQESEHKP